MIAFIDVLSTSFLIWSTNIAVVSGCRNFEGEALDSMLVLPEFETTPSEIDATLNSVLNVADSDLSGVMAISFGREEEEEMDFFETPIAAMERLENFVSHTSNRFSFLSQTSADSQVRDAAESAVLLLESWSVEHMDLNYDLYQLLLAFRDYTSTSPSLSLTGERRRLLDETIAKYERNGMARTQSDRDKLRSWFDRLSNLKSKIFLNIQNDDGIVQYTPEELMGLTPEQLAALEYNETANQYTVRTRIRSESTIIMTYASNRTSRLKALTAGYQRNMDANADLIHEAVTLRQNIAELLGFSSYADYATADRLVGNSESAYQFLSEINNRADEKFELEQGQLLDLIGQQQQQQQQLQLDETDNLDESNISISDLKREDLSYLQNILLERDYQIDHDLISNYFEENTTIRGLFDLYETLFGIKITVQDVAGAPWGAHDIQLAEIYEEDDSDPKNILGAVYLDLHPRDGKFGHFAMAPLVQGRVRAADNKYQAPVAAIIGNFPTATSDGRPSLWRFSNVKTMFHEFGHALHHVLTCTEFSHFAGCNVPRDFVEAPSQMLERWLDDKDVVQQLSQHYETDGHLPEAILENMINSKNVFIAHFLKEQSSYSILDLQIHSYESMNKIPSDGYGLYDVTNSDMATYYYPVPEHTAFLASFQHLFGGYSAGYYGYLWASAIAADLASVFRESDNGRFLDQELGARYRKEILETGSSRGARESIRAFLGRDWNTDAFFEESALPASDPSSSAMTKKNPHSHLLLRRRRL